MIVEVWFDKSSQPILYLDAKATYQKGDIFCIEVKGFRVKYPLAHLFMVRESDFVTSQPLKERLGIANNG